MVTVTGRASPAVLEAGPVKVGVAGLPAFTVSGTVALSAPTAAVMVCAPALVSVAWKVPWPLLTLESGGSVAVASLLVKCARPLAPLPYASWSPTVTERAWPAVLEAGPLKVRVVGLPAVTVSDAVPVTAASLAVSVCEPARASVAWKLPSPVVSGESAGRNAAEEGSLG